MDRFASIASKLPKLAQYSLVGFRKGKRVAPSFVLQWKGFVCFFMVQLAGSVRRETKLPPFPRDSNPFCEYVPVVLPPVVIHSLGFWQLWEG